MKKAAGEGGYASDAFYQCDEKELQNGDESEEKVGPLAAHRDA